jgi:poly-gamma-glutamate synthesis protein (capsule biosynthesis protein)
VAPSCGIPVVSALANAEHLRPAKFDVMTMANNHTIDAGHAAFVECLAVLRQQGIQVVGAGENLARARAPGIVTASGKRVAFLAYTAIYRPGYEAKPNRPGVAALRVHTNFYFPDWHPVGNLEPGAVPHIRTFCYPEDVDMLASAVAAARREADVVAVALHVGDSVRPAFLHDYEHAYPRVAIDAGADMVFATHHHFLRGCTLYRGKPVFHGLGHFTFDLVGLEQALGERQISDMKTMGEYAIYPRPGYPFLPFHPECRMTMMAFCRVSGDGATVESSLVPFVINPENQPIPHGVDTTEGRRVAEYIIGISEAAGLPTRFSFDGPVIAGLRSLAFTAG